MPMPKPRDEEKEADFIERCMGDDAMKEDYSDGDQRLAVCYSQWRKEHPGSAPPEKEGMHMENLERRSLTAEIRALKADDKESRTIAGTAIVFGALSENLGMGPSIGFREKFLRGAFAETLRTDDPVALWNHEAAYPLGRKSSGTLRAHESRTGLEFEIDLPDTGMGNDALELIRRGDVKGVSIGFVTQEDSWETEPGAEPATLNEIRTVRKARLLDISPVTFPAYPQTAVALRSLEQWRKAREAGEAEKEAAAVGVRGRARARRLAIAKAEVVS